uniref:CS domain-containing protein n=1 Tax=Sinocyclocheilus rhinocerous TaxID=307959 RepID=A0A673GW89_9TELE
MMFLSLQGKKAAPCRFDWHQTGSQVTMSIYAKNSNPELCSVKANSTSVSGYKEFELKINLGRDKSVVNMMVTKVEVVMKKAEPMVWAASKKVSAKALRLSQTDSSDQ